MGWVGGWLVDWADFGLGMAIVEVCGGWMNGWRGMDSPSRKILDGQMDGWRGGVRGFYHLRVIQ